MSCALRPKAEKSRILTLEKSRTVCLRQISSAFVEKLDLPLPEKSRAVGQESQNTHKVVNRITFVNNRVRDPRSTQPRLTRTTSPQKRIDPAPTPPHADSGPRQPTSHHAPPTQSPSSSLGPLRPLPGGDGPDGGNE